MTTSPKAARAVTSQLRAVDLFPNSQTHTAYAITAPIGFDPHSLTGQTVTLAGAQVVVREVHEDLSGIGAGEASCIALVDRL